MRPDTPIVYQGVDSFKKAGSNIRVDHKGHSLHGISPAVKICAKVDSPSVKINWDLYHMQIREGDLCGRNEPGTGEIHYNRVFKEAHDLGYRGFVGLECYPRENELVAARRVAVADVW